MEHNPKKDGFLNSQQIADMLRLHQLWLNSGQKEGEKADFSNKEIWKYDFSDAQLHSVIFSNAILKFCNFKSADLSFANFFGADIYRSDFTNANLFEADFSFAALRGCSLKDSLFLTLPALKRSNLKASILPENISFDALLEHTNDLIKKSRTIFGITTGFFLTTLLVILFKAQDGWLQNVSFKLPLSEIELKLTPLVGLSLYVVFLSLLAKFYSISLAVLKKQIDKIPAIFPDGRFAYETIFPWFWVIWIIEIRQTDYSLKDKSECHLLWSRCAIMAFIADIYFATIFAILLIFCKQIEYHYNVIFEKYPIILLSFIAAVLFCITINAAILSRSKFYAVITAIGSIMALLFVYYSTDNYYYMLLTIFCMIASWWWDKIVYQNQQFAFDLSSPDMKLHSKKLDTNMKIVLAHFYSANVSVGLLLCSFIAYYLYQHRF
jgi:uncharacterized protein YjbI with pentapeptide repeats